MMKKLKKALSLTLVLALALALALPVAGADDVGYYQYITFTEEPVSYTQMTTASSQDNFVSFPVWVFPDDAEFTVTIPDGGSVLTEWVNCSADGSQWVAGAGFDVDTFIDDDDSVMSSDTFDVGDGLSRWVVYSSAEYDDEGEYMGPAGEVIEEIYFCTQSSFDLMVAGGAASVEQPTEPEQPTTPAEPEQPTAPAEPEQPSTPTAPSAPIPTSVVLSPQNLAVDGKAVTCEKYNIDGSNYFKLRDLAQVLNGTGSQFGVGFDAETATVTITTGEAYESTGTELATGVDNSATTQPSAQSIQINGTAHAELTVYNIGGSNFFQLRELGNLLGFEVGFDGDTNTATVTSAQK